MDIKLQVCNPEQAKRLKELGLKQSGYFTWMDAKDTKEQWHPCLFQPDHVHDLFCTSYPEGMSFDDFGEDGEFFECGNSYSAFTVAELGAMLPLLAITAEQKSGGYACIILKDGNNDADYRYDIQRGATEAEARADMLIYLLSNNLVTAEECNSRLTA